MKKPSRYRNGLRLFLVLFTAASLPASLLYLTLESLTPSGLVFGALPRMVLYHHQNPFAYIFLATGIYAGLATAMITYRPALAGRKQNFAIIGILTATVIMASIPGGILWKIHDMQAGYFPEGIQFWKDLAWGAGMGLVTGWLIILLSIPFNILGALLGFFVTSFAWARYQNHLGETHTKRSSDDHLL